LQVKALSHRRGRNLGTKADLHVVERAITKVISRGSNLRETAISKMTRIGGTSEGKVGKTKALIEEKIRAGDASRIGIKD